MGETGRLNQRPADAETWIRARVAVTGAIETVHERPWATVLRVPIPDGVAWFKACASVQAFEPRLTAELSARAPELLPEVLDYDEQRSWLLLGDAGKPIGEFGGPPEPWLDVLPRYAELQRAETARAADHVALGVPDMRLPGLPASYQDLLRGELPLAPDEIAALVAFSERFSALCSELEAVGPHATIQHDDLHAANLFRRDDQLRVLDWGDSSISHPFFSLVVPFRFLEEGNRLTPGDPWFGRFRDAYLEPWGAGIIEEFELALRIGAFAHAMAWSRQRDFLPAAERPQFDRWFAVVLRRAIARIAG
jgi:hypothetical protein